MALVKSAGIVFRVSKYRETSIITDIYTRELGLRSYIVNGVRKAKSQFPASLFQVGNILDLIVYDKNAQQLNRIKEVSPGVVYLEIPYKIEKSSIQIFIMELLGKSIKEHESNFPLFDFLVKEFKQLDKMQKGIQYFHLKFILDLSAFLGFRPLNNFSKDKPFFNLQGGMFEPSALTIYHLDEEKSSCLSTLLSTPYDGLNLLQIHKSLRIPLIEELLKYYQYHVEGFKNLKSFEIYRQMF
jgi:DNA repair protein RecO (recombination protein O)